MVLQWRGVTRANASQQASHQQVLHKCELLSVVEPGLRARECVRLENLSVNGATHFSPGGPGPLGPGEGRVEGMGSGGDRRQLREASGTQGGEEESQDSGLPALSGGRCPAEGSHGL